MLHHPSNGGKKATAFRSQNLFFWLVPKGLSILLLFLALHKHLAGMSMFSILTLNFSFSLLGLNTVVLQSLPDDFSNQTSHSRITATLQQLCMDTLFCKMAESPWIQPMLKASMGELLQTLCCHALTNRERKFQGLTQQCHYS